jgi:xanthine dehydrogenase accessory factor
VPADLLVVIKGAGDLATGVAYRLYRAGLPVVMTEVARPTAIRRAVALAETVYEGQVIVEDLCGRLASDPAVAGDILAAGQVPVLVDPEARVIDALRPRAVVDARMAKRNLGTRLDEAPIVVGLGPGFRAGLDVHAVIETLRGHTLGRVLLEGEAQANTGVPGTVGGQSERRVLRAPAAGMFTALRHIGDLVAEGDVVAAVDSRPVVAALSGVLRGILHDGLPVQRGMKVGDVDPRGIREYCFTISDKALAIGGGALEAIL